MSKTKHILISILTYAFGLFMISGGIKHFTMPDPYMAMVPDLLEFKSFIVAASGVVEILLGILLFLKGRLATFGAAMLFIMMLFFLPLHIADLFRDTPNIKGFFPENADMHLVVWMRVGMQLVFILWALLVFRFQKAKNGCFIRKCKI